MNNIPKTLEQWETDLRASTPGVTFKWGEYQSAIRYAFEPDKTTPFAFFDVFVARPFGTYYGGLFAH